MWTYYSNVGEFHKLSGEILDWGSYSLAEGLWTGPLGDVWLNLSLGDLVKKSETQPVLGRFWWENLRGAPCDVVIPDLGCLYTYSSKSRDFLWTTCPTKLRDEDLEKSWTDPSLMQLWIRNYVVILFSPLWSVLIWYNERNTGGTETAVTSACLYFENQSSSVRFYWIT